MTEIYPAYDINVYDCFEVQIYNHTHEFIIFSVNENKKKALQGRHGVENHYSLAIFGHLIQIIQTPVEPLLYT